MNQDASNYLTIKTVSGKHYKVDKGEAKDILSLKRILQIKTKIPVERQIIIINMHIMKNNQMPLHFSHSQSYFILLASTDKPEKDYQGQKMEISQHKKKKNGMPLYHQVKKISWSILRLSVPQKTNFINCFRGMGFPLLSIEKAVKEANNDLNLAQQYLSQGVHKSEGRNLYTLLLCNAKKDNTLKIFFMSPAWNGIKQKLKKTQDINLLYFLLQKISQLFPQMLQFNEALQIISSCIFGRFIDYDEQKHAICRNPNCTHFHGHS